MTIIGIVPLILGLISFEVPLSPLLGGAAVLGSIVLLVAGARRRT